MILASSAPLALLAVFAFSGAAKLRDVDAFADAVAGYRILPASAAKPVAWLVIAGELVTAGLLAIPPARIWGSVLAMGLLAAFLAGMASVSWRGLRADCGCLGRAESVGPATIVRSCALFAVAALSAGAGPETGPVHLLVGFLLLLLVFLLSEVVGLMAGRGLG